MFGGGGWRWGSCLMGRRVRTGKRGHYERGLFTGGISRISKISRFSRFSRKWPDCTLISTVWGFSRISRISNFSRISRKWTFLKRPLFQKTPFPEPDREEKLQNSTWVRFWMGPSWVGPWALVDFREKALETPLPSPLLSDAGPLPWPSPLNLFLI